MSYIIERPKRNTYLERSAKWWIPIHVVRNELTAYLMWLVGVEEWLRNSSQQNMIRLMMGIGNLNYEAVVNKQTGKLKERTPRMAFRQGMTVFNINRASKAILIDIAFARWLKNPLLPESLKQLVKDYYALQAWSASKMKEWEVHIEPTLQRYLPLTCYRKKENRWGHLKTIISREAMKPVWSACKFDVGPYLCHYGYNDAFPKLWKLYNQFDLDRLGVSAKNPTTLRLKDGNWRPDKHYVFAVDVHKRLGKPLPMQWEAIRRAILLARKAEEELLVESD